MVNKNPVFVTILLAIALLLLAKGVAGESPVSIDVLPRFATSNPHQSQTFRVRVRMPEHKDNRIIAISADCGANAYSSQNDVESVTITRFYQMKVVRNCLFVATLFRMEQGKVKRYSDYQEAKIPDDP